MSDGRHAKVRRLFLGACARRGDERARWLDEECGGDRDLRAEVEALVAADADDGGLFERTSEGAAVLAQALADEASAASGLPAPAVEATPEIPGYELRGLLGRGGMGVVHEAVHRDSGRRVALKVLHPSLLTDEFLRRFRREVRVLGQLQHPGIAQVLDSGTSSAAGFDQPFFVMELVSGVPIDRYVREHALDVAARLELVARVCDALHHAHEKGVVHRDLKPGNILVGTELESGSGSSRAALPQPKVLDFGVARAVDADFTTVTLHTAEGQLVGTVPYMSPEQAAGDPGAIDRRSDVYAIGVIAFELLAGCLPYGVRGKLVHEAVRVIREDEPSSLGALDSSLRGDVETIVAKALEKDPDRRYPTAAALAADLRRFNEHLPITARPPSTFYQLGKFARRNKTLVGGAVATLAVALAGAGVAARYAFVANRRASELERLSYRHGIAAARGAVERSDWPTATSLLEAMPAALRGWEHDYLTARIPRPAATWDAPTGPIVAPPVIDADGRTLYALMQAGQDPAPLGPDPTTRLGAWDVTTGRLTGSIPISPDVRAGNRVQIDPATRRFAEHTVSGHVRVRDLEDGRELALLAAPVPGDQVRACLHATGGGRFLFAGPTGAWLCDGLSFEQVEATGPEPAEANPFLVQNGFWLSASGTRILRSDTRAHALTLLDGGSGETLATKAVDDVPLWTSFSPDGRWLATAGAYSSVWLLDGATLATSAELRGHQGRVTHVSWSGDGSRFATVGEDGTARIWTPGSKECVVLATGDRADELSTRTVTFLPGDDALLVTGRELQVFAVPAGADEGGSVVLRGHPSFVYDVALSPDGRLLASSGWRESDVRVWDLAEARLWRVLSGPHPYRAEHHALSFTDDSRALCAPGADGPVTWELFEDRDAPRTWTARPSALEQLGPARLQAATDAHEAEVLCAAFHPDGTRVATGGRDHAIRIWGLTDFEPLFVLRGHEDYVIDLEFSRDGSRLASASGDKTIRLWDTLPLSERRARPAWR